jgi:hypothetical protein
MESTELHRHLTEPMCIGGSIKQEQHSNRRSHERLNGSDLQWLRGARVKYGAAIRVLDISAGGLLLRTEHALKPNTDVVVELTGPDSPILIPSQIIRCRAASLRETLTYEGACAFKRPLTISELTVKLAENTAHPAVSIAHAAPPVRWRKVVAQLNNGRVVCGYTNDFHPSKTQLHISTDPRDGESAAIPLSQLRALFFVREFTDDPTLAEPTFVSEAPHGGTIEVTFCDDEVVIESMLACPTEGFFLRPADPCSNNLGVFVTAAGLQQVRFLLTET